MYQGPIADEIVQTVQQPPKTSGATLPVWPGYLKASDLASYKALDQAPTTVHYRDLTCSGWHPRRRAAPRSARP